MIRRKRYKRFPREPIDWEKVSFFVIFSVAGLLSAAIGAGLTILLIKACG